MSKCASYEDLIQAVLHKLRIPASNIPMSLQLAGEELLKDRPLDLGMETGPELIMLSLTHQGLVGGSLSAKDDVDDGFKRVADDAVPIIIDTKKQ